MSGPGCLEARGFLLNLLSRREELKPLLLHFLYFWGGTGRVGVIVGKSVAA